MSIIEVASVFSEIDAVRESKKCHLKALTLNPKYEAAHEGLDDFEQSVEDPLEASIESLKLAVELSEETKELALSAHISHTKQARPLPYIV